MVRADFVKCIENQVCWFDVQMEGGVIVNERKRHRIAVYLVVGSTKYITMQNVRLGKNGRDKVR